MPQARSRRAQWIQHDGQTNSTYHRRLDEMRWREYDSLILERKQAKLSVKVIRTQLISEYGIDLGIGQIRKRLKMIETKNSSNKTSPLISDQDSTNDMPTVESVAARTVDELESYDMHHSEATTISTTNVDRSNDTTAHIESTEVSDRCSDEETAENIDMVVSARSSLASITEHVETGQDDDLNLSTISGPGFDLLAIESAADCLFYARNFLTAFTLYEEVCQESRSFLLSNSDVNLPREWFTLMMRTVMGASRSAANHQQYNTSHELRKQVVICLDALSNNDQTLDIHNWRASLLSPIWTVSQDTLDMSEGDPQSIPFDRENVNGKVYMKHNVPDVILHTRLCSYFRQAAPVIYGTQNFPSAYQTVLASGSSANIQPMFSVVHKKIMLNLIKKVYQVPSIETALKTTIEKLSPKGQYMLLYSKLYWQVLAFVVNNPATDTLTLGITNMLGDFEFAAIITSFMLPEDIRRPEFNKGPLKDINRYIVAHGQVIRALEGTSERHPGHYPWIEMLDCACSVALRPHYLMRFDDSLSSTYHGSVLGLPYDLHYRRLSVEPNLTNTGLLQPSDMQTEATIFFLQSCLKGEIVLESEILQAIDEHPEWFFDLANENDRERALVLSLKRCRLLSKLQQDQSHVQLIAEKTKPFSALSIRKYFTAKQNAGNTENQEINTLLPAASTMATLQPGLRWSTTSSLREFYDTYLSGRLSFAPNRMSGLVRPSSLMSMDTLSSKFASGIRLSTASSKRRSKVVSSPNDAISK